MSVRARARMCFCPPRHSPHFACTQFLCQFALSLTLPSSPAAASLPTVMHASDDRHLRGGHRRRRDGRRERGPGAGRGEKGA